MTIEELKQHCIRTIRMNEAIESIPNVKITDNRSLQEHKMVLRLIEALDKIRDEIKNYDNFIICANGQIGIHIDKVLEIIDKHLKEVENDNN